MRVLSAIVTLLLLGSSLLAQSTPAEANKCPGLVAVPDSIAPVYNVCAITEKPVRINSPSLAYPALNEPADANVMLELVIDTLGLPEPNTIRVFSTTDGRFNQEALHWVRLTRFRPGMLNGRPVRVLIHIPVQWEAR